ncbi:MAG: single-stranded DNA-binding protein [Bacteroidales bacterium]|nr:single-stranded DNA-binding protein [Bacteroidales bacterium]
MEQLNRVEIIGRVGSAFLNKVGERETPVLRFYVATDYVYKDREGTPIIDTTWHNITWWGDKGGSELDKIVRGCAVHVLGRTRQNRYTNAEGVEKTVQEVVATSVEILDEQVTAQCSF